MNRPCTVEVRGLVSTLLPSGARTAVPRGRYMLSERSLHEYELRRRSGQAFALTLNDVAHYTQGGELAVVEGRWP